MNKGLFIAGLLVSAVAAGAQTNVPIYIHIVSHNEDASPYNANSNLYALERAQVVAFANMLRSNGAWYCWQSDWRFLAAVTNWDRGTASTGGTNVVAWLRATGHEVDPHSHENGVNYADVAELIRRCGVEPTAVVGGAIVHPAVSSIYDRISATMTGIVFTAATWTPEIVWGGGTAMHVDQSNIWYSGCRRVRDREHYFEHSPTGRLVAVGGYGERDNRWTNLNQLIALRAAGQLCTNKIHTCLIMNNQPELNAAYIAAFDAQLKTYSNVPNLVWTTVTNIVEVWRTQYGGEPSIIPYYHEHDIDADGLDDGWEMTNNCDLSWSDGATDFDGDSQSDRAEYGAVTDPTDPASWFGGAMPSAGVLSWNAAAGRVYDVETAGAVTGSWAAVHTVTGAAATVSYTNAAAANLFYRLRVRW